jgi:hypothetical protein
VFNGDDEDDVDAEVSGVEEPLEEIDFSEIGKLQAVVDAAAAKRPENPASGHQVISEVEERFTGFYIDPNPGPSPRAARSSHAAETALGDSEDEVIVYVAPLPRAGPITPPRSEPVQQTQPYTSILTGKQGPADEVATSEPCTEETVGTVSQDVMEAKTTEHFAAESHTPAVETTGEPDQTPATTSEKVTEKVEVVIESEVKAVVAEETPPVTAAPAFSDVTFSFASKLTQEKKLTRKVHPVRTPKALLRRAQPRRKPLRGFGTFGAQLEEAHLHEGEREDPRKNERRRGDSDLDWGSGSEVEDAIEELSTGIGGMEIDEDLDANAMASFVKSMSAAGSHQVTMDDLADIERLKAEDEEDESSSSGSEDEKDSELEAVVRMEEDAFVAEANVNTADGKAEDILNSDDEQDEDVSSDDEETPRRGFQARLEKIRKSANGKQKFIPAEDMSSDEDDDEDVELSLDMPWADKDEEYIEIIQVCAFWSKIQRLL